MEIIFRACEQEQSLSYVERWHPSKVEILKKCWLSFQDSINQTQDSITIMYDNVSKETLEFLKNTAKASYKLIEIPPHTFHYNLHTVKLFEYLEEQIEKRPNEDFLILEDDYLFIPNSLNILRKAQKEWNSFILPYDYPDRYKKPSEARYILILANHHWATVTSSCTTFSVNSKTLKKCISIFKVAAPQSDDRMYSQIYNQLGCIAPIPSLSTHLTKHHLSPTIDWQHVWDNIKI